MPKQKIILKDKLKEMKNCLNKKLKKIKKVKSDQLTHKNDPKKISLSLLIFTYVFISSVSIKYFIHPSKTTPQPQTLGIDTSFNLEKEKVFWVNYLKQHPNYIDGWLELTKIEYRMGHISNAIRNLERAKNINPNLLKVKNTEAELGL